MSYAPPPVDNPTAPQSGPRLLAGDEFMPPVEPPSAGFIIQLFVVPAVIVMLIVAVWLTVSWLVHRTRPQDLIQGLEGSGVARWQKASELADILRNERFADFKRNKEAASRLADNLRREIEAANVAGGMDGESVMLRFFLCRALGEFEVTDGMDALVLAAETNRDPAEQLVRRGAVQAIAMRAFKLHEQGSTESLSDPKLEAVLLRLSEDEDALIRSETAYALGRIGTPVCIERLEVLIGDPHADTRYNAAVALAHEGKAAAAGMLAEMIEPVALASALEEPDPPSQVRKRATILHNALEAAEALAKKNPTADLTAIKESLQSLADADEAALGKALIPRGAISAAKRTLETLSNGE